MTPKDIQESLQVIQSNSEQAAFCNFYYIWGQLDESPAPEGFTTFYLYQLFVFFLFFG